MPLERVACIFTSFCPLPFKEISYVFAGAGVSTALISMKAMERYRWERRYRELQAITAEREAAVQREARAVARRLAAKFAEWEGR